MGGKIVLVVWEDSEVEELETRRDGGIWSLVLDPKRAPVFSDPWQMLAHAEEVCTGNFDPEQLRRISF